MSLFLVDGFSVSDCDVCLHSCFGIRTWSLLSLLVTIILSSVRFLFVLCLFVPLPSLAWKMCLPPYLCSSPPTKHYFCHAALPPPLYSFSDYPGFFPLFFFCYSTFPRPFCYRISQSSQSQSRGYAKPWLAHSKTPTPTKCQSCPEHSQTPGHEVTHCPLPVP